jgi:hypothetical protein
MNVFARRTPASPHGDGRGRLGCGDTRTEPANQRKLEQPDPQRILQKRAYEQHSGTLALVETKDGLWRGAVSYAEASDESTRRTYSGSPARRRPRRYSSRSLQSVLLMPS